MRKYAKNVLTFLLFYGLILGVHRGKVALLEKETGKALEVFPLRACLLPPADQKALANGISIGSPEALARLLEDYLS